MQPCPRQVNEATMASQLAHQSHWEANGTCSYCGSISPDMLFKAIEDGCELGPTDKSYKVYVSLPEPGAGKPWIYSTANYEFKPGIGQITKAMFDQTDMPKAWKSTYVGQYGQLEPKGSIWHAKFYFQHFTEDECQRFIDLYNQKKMKIGYPGHFYRFPFFMVAK